MAANRNPVGRPRITVKSACVSLLIPEPEKKMMQQVARREGLSLASWIRYQALRALMQAA
jgi:hypothetical protein